MTDLLDRLRAALGDRYRIERELGRGGMAIVYLAEDRKHQRKVALKVLRPELAASLGAERFLREISTAAQLAHPNILPLYDSGEADGTLYYTMPYVAGESLRDRLSRERQLPIQDALQITREVADALGHAHTQGIVHRDIKPENILLADGRAVVADFGIAKAVTAAGGERLTETGLAVGTPAYMSPEQGTGTADLDGRSDLYSLGCVLYEMLSGETPYTGPTPMAIIAKKLSEPVPRVSVVRETVPTAVELALTSVLARNPVDRFATPAQFTAALTADVVPPPPPSPRPRLPRLVTAAVAVLLVGTGAWVAVTQWHSAPGPAGPVIPIDTAKMAVLPFQVIGADSTSPLSAQSRSVGDLFEVKVSSAFGRRIAHPGSVLQRWRAVGGSTDSALTEAQEIEIGRQVGAGRVVRGTVVGSDHHLAIAASMIDVRDGTVLVPMVRVEGSPAEWQDLVDQLIVELLTRDARWFSDRSPRLVHYEPDAIQAYLAGRWAVALSDEQNRLFKEALRLDSNLVDAALWTFAAGERDADTVALRYALEHQDQLSARARDYATVLAGKAFGTFRTARQLMEAYRDFTRRWPEWGTPWAEFGVTYFQIGALAGVADWRHRAQDALDRAPRDNEWALFHSADLAFVQEDTARARELTERFTPWMRPGGFVTEWGSAFPWRLAILVGDTAGAKQALDSVLSSFAVFAMAYGDGRGIADADHVVAQSPPSRLQWDWALTRGKYGAFQDRWTRNRPWEVPVLAPYGVYWALFRDVPIDSTTAMAVETLDLVALGEGPQATDDQRAMAAFWTALWRLSRGDTVGVAGTVRRLRDEGRRWGQLAVSASMLEAVQVEVDGGDARAALLRLDSAARSLPLPTGGGQGLMPAEVQNLFLARELRRVGETERALAASRRRFYGSYAFWVDALPEYLREEGRLAAAVGDTAGAIRAYDHYLALRSDPEPPWRAEWQQVRQELAALVGR